MRNTINQPLDQALAVLDDAAASGSEDLKRLLRNNYRRLHRTVVEITPEPGTFQEVGRQSVEALARARDRVTGLSSKAASRVDREARRSPWLFMAGAATAAAALVLWLGRKSN